MSKRSFIGVVIAGVMAFVPLLAQAATSHKPAAASAAIDHATKTSHKHAMHKKSSKMPKPAHHKTAAPKSKAKKTPSM